jgi:hypothetical protein
MAACEGNDDELVVQVIDTGAGIAAQELGMIFEEFRTKEPSSSEWHSGTGLGLPISKKFVELHHGRMGVESAFGKGTTFWFTLPCPANQTANQAEDPIAIQNGQAAMQRERYTPLLRLDASERILVVVDEDAHTASLLRRYLDGYKIIGVATYADGVRLVEEVKALALVVPNSIQCHSSMSGVKDDCHADGIGVEGAPKSVREALTIRLPLPNARVASAKYRVFGLLGKPVARHELVGALARLPSIPKRVLVVDDDPMWDGSLVVCCARSRVCKRC